MTDGHTHVRADLRYLATTSAPTTASNSNCSAPTARRAAAASR